LACNAEVGDWALPFEWDRSWRLQAGKKELERTTRDKWGLLDVQAMQEAAAHLLGTHDFSSFRAAHCQRNSPIVTLSDIQIHSQSYGEPLLWDAASGKGLLGLGGGGNNGPYPLLPQLVTIQFVGNSFVYHQVRNMVGALVAVGRGQISPRDMKEILEACDRRKAPAMAPAHGLFLAHVQHDDIDL
jgi:tRNA pseudouridine38-40 synthase